MLDIRCSAIENCRQQPGLYGKMIALKQKLGEKINGNFNSGMASKWRMAALTVHRGDHLHTTYRNLETSLSLFVSKACKEKQQTYIDSFTAYFQQMISMGWKFVTGGQLISWEGLHTDVRLTGKAPWIAKRKGEYYCYFITESPYPGWHEQIKYPLLQQYIATHILECDPQQVSIGIYSILDKQFIMHKYSETELQQHVQVTKAIFAAMHHAFERELHSI